MPVRPSSSVLQPRSGDRWVATDANPWIVRKQRFLVPKNLWTGNNISDPWLMQAVPLALNRNRLPASVFHKPTIDRSKMLHGVACHHDITARRLSLW
jgi:hypothetical protein